MCIRDRRKVVVSGRSMENVTAKALELGYLKAPKDTILDVDHMKGIPDDKLVIITTGSQGEPMSALTPVSYTHLPMILLSTANRSKSCAL